VQRRVPVGLLGLGSKQPRAVAVGQLLGSLLQARSGPTDERPAQEKRDAAVKKPGLSVALDA
jgi:hypothetical protein